MMKTVLEKDPVSDFLKFAREQEERERQHELTVIKLLMGQPPAQIPVPNLQNQHLNNMPPCNNEPPGGFFRYMQQIQQNTEDDGFLTIP